LIRSPLRLPVHSLNEDRLINTLTFPTMIARLFLAFACTLIGPFATAQSTLPVAPDLVVAADGSGDFTSIHAAVQSISKDNRERRVILVKNGTYRERVRVTAASITLRGESRAGTRLEFNHPARPRRS